MKKAITYPKCVVEILDKLLQFKVGLAVGRPCNHADSNKLREERSAALAQYDLSSVNRFAREIACCVLSGG